MKRGEDAGPYVGPWSHEADNTRQIAAPPPPSVSGQCGYVSPIDGARCRFYASFHSMHDIPEPGDDTTLRRSPEDSPDWDPEGVKAWRAERVVDPGDDPQEDVA